MRQSIASAALIRRKAKGRALWLAQWNEKWGRYSFVSGHKREAESFRQCMVRELGEELQLLEGTDFVLTDEPLARYHYTAWSRSAEAETEYTIALFEVRLTGESAMQTVEDNAENRWLTEAEISAGRSEDGSAVSETMGRLLRDAGLLSSVIAACRPENTDDERVELTMITGAEVNVLNRARMKLWPDLVKQFRSELATVFPDATAITVCDCFRGYSSDQKEKVVLGVEVRLPEAYYTHVIKLGTREAVGGDYAGWHKCFVGRPFASRILVNVTMREVGDDRVAVIYEDAYHLYGEHLDANSPEDLETVAHLAINDGKPDPISVERVIRQIYSDLHRWFYRSPRADSKGALAFYNRRLARAKDCWSSEELRIGLRRDLVWLLSGQRSPAGTTDLTYLDPCDYVRWALREGLIPQTLVGRSHGDIHGLNILVGTQRGEAEYPSVFDYGEMGDSNVLVWDFVKLEAELKVRLLVSLYEDHDVRNKVLSLGERDRQWGDLVANSEPSAKVDRRMRRGRLLAFAFEIETCLADQTNAIGGLSGEESLEPPEGRKITGNEKLDRALAILLRIRQEAALWLGTHQQQRGHRHFWRDEYYFALAVYGLSTAKWDYREYETVFAIVSAGVAAAHVTTTGEKIRKLLTMRSTPPPPYPCYQVPLVHAHRLWKAKRIKKARELLTEAIKQFPHGAPLLQEYALVLAEAGQYDEVFNLLGPFYDLCQAFRDHEALSRIGRSWKDRGEATLSKGPVKFEDLPSHPAWQSYKRAYDHYLKAYEMADDKTKYYPGINAATMALLHGRNDQAEDLARDVLKICASQDLSTIGADERFWVWASQGEAALLLKDSRMATAFYDQALARLQPDQVGMAQSAYKQLCRLWWALGESIVGPVVKLFRQAKIWGQLAAGPLDNCGMRRTGEARGAARSRKKTKRSRRKPSS